VGGGGTGSPTAPLHIVGAGGASDDSATNLATSVSKQKIRFQNRTSSSLSQYHGTVNSGDTWYQQIANGTGTSSYNMVFNPFGGNVGIGTTSPGAKLDVNGNFLCRSPNTHRVSESIASFITRVTSDINLTGLSETVRLAGSQRSGFVKIHYQAGVANSTGGLQHSTYALYGFSWGGDTRFYTHEHSKTQLTATTISFSVVADGTVTLSVSTPSYGSYCSLYTEWFYGRTGDSGLYVNV